MGLGNYPFAALTTIQNITLHLLEKFTPKQIADAGTEVICLLETIRVQHPDQVPTYESGGGLLDVPIRKFPVGDFELARHLIDTNHSDMAKVVSGANGVPVLFAYLAIITFGSKLPDEYLLESALPFAVESLAVGGELEKRKRLELKAKSDAAAKLMSKRNAGNASMPRPNARAIDHDDVLHEYQRLIQQGHTQREARGILVQRENMGSQSTIHRVTKEK